MSGPVIIRLQNLPLEARSIDIRKFFDGCVIPDGGVHIIGGEKGDAFIAFQSDEDARLAMARDGYFLCNSRIKLYLSSKTEMQNVIAAARNQLIAPQISAQQQAPQTQTLPNATNLNNVVNSVVSNPNILESLTKIISTNSIKQASAGPSLNGVLQSSSLTSALNSIQPDPLKTLTSLLPQLKPTQTLITPAISTSSTNMTTSSSNLLHQPPTQTFTPYTKPIHQSNPHLMHNNMNTHAAAVTTTSNSANGANGQQSNINIDQILSLLKNHLNKPNDPTSNLLNSLSKTNGNSSSSQNNNSVYQPQSGGAMPQPAKKKTLFSAPPPTGSSNTAQVAYAQTAYSQPKKTLLSNSTAQPELSLKRKYDSNSTPSFSNPTNNYNKQSNDSFANGGQQTASKKKVLLPTPPPHSDNGNSTTQEQQSFSDPNFGNYFLKIYGLPMDFDMESIKNLFNNVNFLQILTVKTPITSKVPQPDGTIQQQTVIKAKRICQVESRLDLDKALTRQDERVGKSKIQIFKINKSEFDSESVKYKQQLEEEDKEKELEQEENQHQQHHELNGLSDNHNGENGNNNHLVNNEEDDYSRSSFISNSNNDSNESSEFVKNNNNNNNSNNKKSLLPIPAASQSSDNLSINGTNKRSSPSSNDLTQNKSNKRIKTLLPTPPMPNLSNQNPLIQPVIIDLPPLPPELQKYTNSIVLLSNVSHKATREDLLDLFKEYSPIEETLKIRHDDQGRPTGDAIVACGTQEEAFKAAQLLNNCDYMGTRICAVLISPQ